MKGYFRYIMIGVWLNMMMQAALVFIIYPPLDGFQFVSVISLNLLVASNAGRLAGDWHVRISQCIGFAGLTTYFAALLIQGADVVTYFQFSHVFFCLLLSSMVGMNWELSTLVRDTINLKSLFHVYRQ